MASVALLASGAGVLIVALQLAARLGSRLTPGDPASCGYTTGDCQAGGGDRLAYSLWFPSKPRPALPYFSYLQSTGARPAPPWVLGGRAGRIIAALALTLAPYLFRSTAVGSTSTAHWRRSTTQSRGAASTGGLVIFVQGFEAFSFIAAELCEALATRGYAVAAIDLSKHEAVESRLSAVTALLEHVLREHAQHLDPRRVAVVGHSRGGSQGVHLALSDERVRGAVLLHSNAGDLRALMQSRPLPPLAGRAGTPPAALLAVHASDDTAVRVDNHAAWVGLFDEHASPDARRYHAIVRGPCGHDGCTSLLSLLSFAMPRW